MLLLKSLTQELLGVHLSSWTSQSQKVTLSLTLLPPGKSCCPSREDHGTKSLVRVPVTLAHRWPLSIWMFVNIILHKQFSSPSCSRIILEKQIRHTQVNLVTSWIDGSSIYGPSTSWSDSLRSFSGGLLTSGSEWNMPSQANGRNLMWSAADPATGDHGSQGLHGETFYTWYFRSAPNTVNTEFILLSRQWGLQ